MIAPKEFGNIWNRPAIRIGVITVAIPMVMCFLPNLYLYMRYGVFPPLPVAMKAWGMIAAIFGAFYICEPVSYYPILGLTGTYISFLSGNIGNLRLPCSAVAQEVVGVEPGTQEAEIASTLGVAGSVITNLFFTTLAALLGTALLAAMPDSIALAFKKYTVAAIFGAVYGQFTLKYPKLAIFGVGLPLSVKFLSLVLHIPFIGQAWLLIVLSVFGTMLIGRVMYKAGLL